MLRYDRALLFAAALTAWPSLSGPATASVCMERWKEDRAVHAELQRKAIEELNNKDYAAACKTMRELAQVGQSMRIWLERNCRGNENAKRMTARADTIAARADEICAQAEKR
jgi:hypothetical protein